MDNIMSCISDPLEMAVVTNTKFLDIFKLDDSIQVANYMNNALYVYCRVDTKEINSLMYIENYMNNAVYEESF